MIKQNLHTHCNLCDGKDSIEDIVKTAVKSRFDSLGFSSHSFVPFDDDYCLNDKTLPVYIDSVNEMKVKYKDVLNIYLGLEQDFFSAPPKGKFDFIIGSVHYVKKNGEYIPLDISEELIKRAVEKHYAGDIYALLEDYFKNVGELAEKTSCDIIGHFDLPTKFCEKGSFLFDMEEKRYVCAAEKAINKLCQSNIFFEINTGAMAKGRRTAPYPNYTFIKKIADAGGKFVLTSDCHDMTKLDFAFEDTLKRIKNMGINEIYTLQGKQFVKEKIDV